MKCVPKLVWGLAAYALLLAGCDQRPAGSEIAVVDLAAVAEATGQDALIRLFRPPGYPFSFGLDFQLQQPQGLTLPNYQPKQISELGLG